MTLSAKIKKTINAGVQIIVAIFALWFIYRQVFSTGNLQFYINTVMTHRIDKVFIVLMAVVMLIMPVNWGVEAYKWQILISHVEHVSFLQAIKSVFTGITVSVFTPNRVGEFFGRLLTLKNNHPLKGAFLTITGSVSQLLTTLLMGFFAICFYIPTYYNLHKTSYLLIYSGLVLLLIIIGIVMISLFLKASSISGLSKAFIRPGWQKIRGYLRIMRQLNRKLLIRVLMLSMLRYLIFSTQYYILLRTFGLSIPWFQAFILISMTYFVMAAIPTIALVDLGIRGSVSIYFIGQYFGDKIGVSVSILAASTAIWIINLAIPALIGMFFINRLKIIRKVS
ncbi:MAG: lysylphosphatidylglycerol synthase domain-containing protein [Lentimicrobiaceae bacterium]